MIPQLPEGESASMPDITALNNQYDRHGYRPPTLLHAESKLAREQEVGESDLAAKGTENCAKSSRRGEGSDTMMAPASICGRAPSTAQSFLTSLSSAHEGHMVCMLSVFRELPLDKPGYVRSQRSAGLANVVRKWISGAAPGRSTPI